MLISIKHDKNSMLLAVLMQFFDIFAMRLFLSWLIYLSNTALYNYTVQFSSRTHHQYADFAPCSFWDELTVPVCQGEVERSAPNSVMVIERNATRALNA